LLQPNRFTSFISFDPENKLIIPYERNLTDLESRFTSLENKTTGLTIENNGIELLIPLIQKRK
jgi:hypothetical protein